MNHVRPHKLKRDPGVERGENPLALFLFYHTADVVTMRIADRSGNGPCDRGGQAQRQQGLRPPRSSPRGDMPSGRKTPPPFASPALPIVLAWVKGRLRPFLTPLTLCANDPGDRGGASTGRKGGWKRKMMDTDQGKSFLEWVLIFLRLFREIWTYVNSLDIKKWS